MPIKAVVSQNSKKSLIYMQGATKGESCKGRTEGKGRNFLVTIGLGKEKSKPKSGQALTFDNNLIFPRTPP